MFGDFQSWMGEQVFWLFMVIGAWAWIIKRFASPKIKDAAKEAATSQALGWINRFVKK